MAKKTEKVYRLFCTYEHDSAACQEALRILRTVELTPEQIAKIKAVDDEKPKAMEDVMMTNTELKTYNLDEELHLLESHYGKEKAEAVMAHFAKNGYISDNPARDIHVLVETDLLNQSREVLEGMRKLSDRQQEYNHLYGRRSQPKTAGGRLRARVREEVYMRGIDAAAIDTAMGMPDGWYSKAVNQRGNFEWWQFYYIAKALKIPCDDLVGTAPGLAS